MATGTAVAKATDCKWLLWRCGLCRERVSFFRAWWQSQALLRPGKARPRVHPKGLLFDLAPFIPFGPTHAIVIDVESENILWNPQPIRSWFISPLVGSVPEKWEDADFLPIRGRRFEAIPPFTDYAKRHWCDAGTKDGECTKLAGAQVPSELEGMVDLESYWRLNRALAKGVKPRRGKALSKAIDKALRKLAVERRNEEKKQWKSGRMSRKSKAMMISSVAVQNAIFRTACLEIDKRYTKGIDPAERHQIASLLKADVSIALHKMFCSDGRKLKGERTRQWRSGKPITVIVDAKEVLFTHKTAGLIRLAQRHTQLIANRTMGKEWMQYRTWAFAPAEAATAVTPEFEFKNADWLQRRKAPPDGCIEWNEDRSKRRWLILPNGRKLPLVSDSFVPMAPACIPEGNGNIDMNRFAEPAFGNLKLHCDKHKTQTVEEIDMLGSIKLECGCVRQGVTHISKEGWNTVWPCTYPNDDSLKEWFYNVRAFSVWPRITE